MDVMNEPLGRSMRQMQDRPMTSILAVRVTPRSAKPGIGSWRTGPDGRDELEVRVAEAPTDGAANDAVVRLLAKALGLPKSQILIVAGANSRHKRLRTPLAEPALRSRLDA
jgi:uncharacterized protein (TIGR00251 family)